jgi:hypothetical protein
MTARNLTGRVARLETTGAGNGWRAWAARPATEWPDAALHDFICATVPRLAGRRDLLMDDELNAIESIEGGA